MLPVHLRPYVVSQNYDHYTPINQAVWRYVMRQFHAYFKDKAHPAYYNGLQSSGITIEQIPDVATMNRLMSRFGWSTVVVDGLVPTSVFMDFQAHRILPISVDIRTLDHLGYTPAPDIIHETAGHAPILVDPDYSAFVQRFGEIGARAFSSRADRDLYEATKHLSVVKESPSATAADVEAAEARLSAALAAVVAPSEETLAGRLYWWTVEYGLIGSLESPRIYGAGLLSSVAESKVCYTDMIKKVPFDLDRCIATGFDITTYQPQLFVCESFEQLLAAIEAFEGRMAYRLGGKVALERAQASEALATIVLSSGLQLTGLVSEWWADGAGEPAGFRLSGPSALAVEDRQLPGFAKGDNPEGFVVPLGLLEGETTPIEDFDEAALKRWNLEPGRMATLRFASGMVVTGAVAFMRRAGGKIVLIGFEGASVSHGERELFRSYSDVYPMPLGAGVVSGYAGAADKAAYFGGAEVEIPEKSLLYAMSDRERRLQALYAEVRTVREQAPAASELESRLGDVMAALEADYAEDWLLRLELLELLGERGLAPAAQAKLRAQLEVLQAEPDQARLIADGLALVKPAQVV